jgi:hypothetical protein
VLLSVQLPTAEVHEASAAADPQLLQGQLLPLLLSLLLQDQLLPLLLSLLLSLPLLLLLLLSLLLPLPLLLSLLLPLLLTRSCWPTSPPTL